VETIAADSKVPASGAAQPAAANASAAVASRAQRRWFNVGGRTSPKDFLPEILGALVLVRMPKARR